MASGRAEELQRAAEGACEAAGALWIFAYGSLMWDPRFPVAESRPARLNGYHRALSILSIANRGTPERPGLVVGLDRGGSCLGRALKVAAADREETIAHLERRELSTDAYRPRTVPVIGDDERTMAALTFVARPGHPQHVRGLSAVDQARLIRQGVGPYGSSLDYLRNVCEHLRALGIPDGPLHRVLALATAMP
jgi:cation transport protein ChaC